MIRTSTHQIMIEPKAFVVITDRDGVVVETYLPSVRQEFLQDAVFLLDRDEPSGAPHAAWKWGGGAFSFVSFDPTRHPSLGKDL